MKQPTKKQTALLKYIDQFTEEHDYSPSYREIMRAMKLNSVSAVAEHVNNCVAAGFLKKNPNEARSLKVIPIKDYKETKGLFRQKIAEIDAMLNASPGEDGTVPTLSAEKRRSLEDDKITLKAAANLLDLDL
jgi:repressor LexA